MILNDLFESRMSELDIEYQDWKNLEPVAFYSRYKMSKDDWASKYWSLIKSSETVHEMDKSQPGQERHGDYPLGAKGTNVKPVAPKKVVKDLTKVLDRAFDKEKSVKEGIMDVVKQTFNDNVAGWPMGTSDEQFIQGWARDIKARTGKTIPTEKLAQLYNNYVKRSGELMQSHSTTNEGSQQFGKSEPYWVCVDGKKWKRFETYQQARNVHDKLEKKLRSEGSDKKVSLLADDQLDEKQDACYRKVKSRYKVWPSAYASGALVQCRKKGAATWGNKSKK